MVFGSTDRIFYKYTAGGTKLVKHTVPAQGTGTTTNYIGNMVYTGGTLSYILTGEGRIVPYGTGADRKFIYEYSLKDHLGNSRVTFMGTDLGGSVDIVQTASYYPFGLVMSQVNGNTSSDYMKNKYLYNGKELQDDKMISEVLNWYDYGARFYDPQIGRWNVVDPMIEKHYEYTPYAYVYNNPIRHIDPFGLDTLLINQKSGKVVDVHKGGEDYVYYTRKKKGGDKAWKNSKQLFHALNISGESGGESSRKGDPVVWSNLKDYTDDFNRALSSVSTYWEAEKSRLEEGQSVFPGEKEILRILYWRSSVDDGQWMDIKRGPYHPSIKGEWSWYNGTLVRYDDYGNMLQKPGILTTSRLFSCQS